MVPCLPLSSAVLLNVAFASTFAGANLYPALSAFFSVGLGLSPLSIPQLLLIFCPPVSFSVAYWKSCTEAKSNAAQLQWARLIMLWWILCAGLLAFWTKGGPLVIPSVVVLTLLSGVLSISITLNASPDAEDKTIKA